MIWKNKYDIIGLIFYTVIWGIPLLFMLIFTFMGEIPLGIIIFYELPTIISLIALEPWKKHKTPGDEQVQYIIHGTLPESSKTTRFIKALMPAYNIFIAWGTIENWLAKIRGSSGFKH